MLLIKSFRTILPYIHSKHNCAVDYQHNSVCNSLLPWLTPDTNLVWKNERKDQEKVILKS